MTDEPSALAGRYVRLDVLTAEHEAVLFPLAARGEIPWQWAGLAPTSDSFHQSMWSRALLNQAIHLRDGGQFVGFVGAYGANFHHGVAFFQITIHPDARGTVVAVEASELFLAHLFERFPLRKIYAEVTDFSLGQFGLAIKITPFRMEATLKEYIFARGAYRDVHMLAMRRDDFYDYLNVKTDRRQRLRLELDMAR